MTQISEHMARLADGLATYRDRLAEGLDGMTQAEEAAREIAQLLDPGGEPEPEPKWIRRSIPGLVYRVTDAAPQYRIDDRSMMVPGRRFSGLVVGFTIVMHGLNPAHTDARHVLCWVVDAGNGRLLGQGIVKGDEFGLSHGFTLHGEPKRGGRRRHNAILVGEHQVVLHASPDWTELTFGDRAFRSSPGDLPFEPIGPLRIHLGAVLKRNDRGEVAEAPWPDGTEFHDLVVEWLPA